MSDHTEPALEPAGGPEAVVVPGDPAAGELPEASGPGEEVFPQAEAQRPAAGRTAPRSGIGFVFKVNVKQGRIGGKCRINRLEDKSNI